MSNPNKVAGTRWESAIRDTMRAFFGDRYGLRPFKPHHEGHEDVGDLHGFGPFVVQAKAYRSIVDGIREGLDGAERQKRPAGLAYGVAIVKRPRKSVGQGLAVMSVETFARVCIRLAQAEQAVSLFAPAELLPELDRRLAEDLATPYPTK